MKLQNALMRKLNCFLKTFVNRLVYLSNLYSRRHRRKVYTSAPLEALGFKGGRTEVTGETQQGNAHGDLQVKFSIGFFSSFPFFCKLKTNIGFRNSCFFNQLFFFFLDPWRFMSTCCVMVWNNSDR